MGSYIKPGSHVIDVGAGQGYFSIPLAKLVGSAGHVTAIDIQAHMLLALTRRAQKSGLSERITTYLASPDYLGHHSKADFILAFWMSHEVSDQRRFLSEIYNLLKPGGIFLLAEPLGHVPKGRFLRTLRTAGEIGLAVKDKPKIRMSRSALFIRAEDGL